MNKKIFSLLEIYARKVNQLDLFSKYHCYHNVYQQLINLIVENNFNNIGFIFKKPDDIDFFAIMDELIKNQKTIYYSKKDYQNYQFYILDNLYQEFKYENGEIDYKNVNYITINRIKVMIVPLQITANNLGVITEKSLFELLDNFDGYKVGIGYKFCEVTDSEIKNADLIKFEKIILV